MNLTIDTEQEDDGRWVAKVPELASALARGRTREEAMAKAEALALRALIERLEHGEARAVDLCGMSRFPASKARRVLVAALLPIGWTVKRQIGLASHAVAQRLAGRGFGFHDDEELGPVMLSRIAKRMGLTLDDL